MRILIVGIGGIGGFIGSRLAKKYSGKGEHEIIFLQRGEHADSIKQNGLHYIAKQEEIISPDEVVTSASEVGQCDLIVFCVKSKDLENTAKLLSANISSTTTLLTTLNGVDNAQRLQTIYPNTTVLNGCIYVSAFIEKPGVVKQRGGAGNLYFGSEEKHTKLFLQIEKIFKDAGIKAVLSNDIVTDVWKKYLFISAFATITSVYDLPFGGVMENNDRKAEVEILLQEIFSIGLHLGAKLKKEFITDALYRAKHLIPYDTATSMQLDFQSGKIPELDIFTGYIVNTGRRLNVPTPLHNTFYKMLQDKTSSDASEL